MTAWDELKKAAALQALAFLEPGMVVGLGTGSTVRFALEGLGEKLRTGELKNIIGIPSSIQTEKIAYRLNIPLTDFIHHSQIDVTIDGADEVDDQLNLIKGGGGALLREKVLAQASRQNIIIVDASKVTGVLGTKWALPVEVIPFAAEIEKKYLQTLGASVELRKTPSGDIYKTDQNNYILDANFGQISDPYKLAADLNPRAGIVEHGLFLNLASKVIVAESAGIRILEK